VKIEIDTNVDGPKEYGAVAALLLLMTGKGEPSEAPAAAPAAPAAAPAAPAAAPAAPTIPTIPVPDEVVEAATYVGEVDPHERDADGLPWDGRIHSESRARNKDGTWRQRRNLDRDLLTTVEAELRGVTTPASVVVPPPPPLVAVAPPALVAAAPPALVVVPPVPAPSPLPAAPTEITVPEAMSRITANMKAGLLSSIALIEACRQVGLSHGLAELSDRPDLIVPLLQKVGIL